MTIVVKDKCACEQCDWRGYLRDLLHAKNPFDHEDDIIGCPKCKAVDSVRTVCDEPFCWREASCGAPVPDGYRRTCGEHMPPAHREEK